MMRPFAVINGYILNHLKCFSNYRQNCFAKYPAIADICIFLRYTLLCKENSVRSILIII